MVYYSAVLLHLKVLEYAVRILHGNEVEAPFLAAISRDSNAGPAFVFFLQKELRA